MDEVLHMQFERVEAALATLVDSIATYNPSPQAALDLVTADDELAKGLDQLSRHQANHARILALRSEAEALEAQLTSSVSALAALRHDLFQTSTTNPDEDAHSVPFDELLHNAMAISRYTVPPTYREHVPKAASDADKDEGKPPASAAATAPSNGLGTPAVSSAAEDVVQGNANGEGEATMDVTPEQAQWLQKLREHGVPWMPWPNDDKIRRGNLMTVQHLLDLKKDPWADRVSPHQELELGSQQQKEPEEQWQAQAQAQVQAPAVQRPQVATRSESTTTGFREQAPAQLFTGFDFADDDDE